MNIICTILAGIRCLMERVSEWAGRRKISKKSRRDKAVFVVGAIAVAAISFSCNSVHAQGKNQEETPKQKEERKEEADTEEEEVCELGSIIQGPLAGQEAQSEVNEVEYYVEDRLRFQKVSKKELDSHLDCTEKSSENLELLNNKTIGKSEQHLTMSDEEYETLLKIVEAKA